MSKLQVLNLIPDSYNRQAFAKILNSIADQLNNLAGGAMSARYNATSSVPTTGSYAVGDFVPNSAITELGVAGSKYVLLGWVATSSSPLVFKECRALTGN